MAPIELFRTWRAALLLGLATIGAYGTVYYSFGVLIPVVELDTGWSTGTLSAAFSLAILGQGFIAIVAGRTFDRTGSTPILLPATLADSLLLFLASSAQESWHFVLLWALGGSVIGGSLYYNVTMPITARLHLGRRDDATPCGTIAGCYAFAAVAVLALTAALQGAPETFMVGCFSLVSGMSLGFCRPWTAYFKPRYSAIAACRSTRNHIAYSSVSVTEAALYR